MGNAGRDPVQHRRVRDLFHQVCDLDPAGRRAALDEACGDDAELRQEIESLLALDRPELAEVLRLPDAAPAELAGTVIGRYRLLEVIGEGGFGTVHLAEQTEPVVRRVALKVLKAGLDTPRLLAGFERERQTLADMDHPGIARLFDAGVTERGLPYFVMEWVQGEPVTTFCDRERLTLGRRLELFRSICDAVQHAHGKGVVHRDLKPSNVLVTLSHGTPEAKVIDFGIARSTTSPRTDSAGPAVSYPLIGTLHYMSPEQVVGSGLDIDTRSDVYSLGILLYELLTGSTPFALERPAVSPLAEIQRRIREEEPELLSRRLIAGSTGDGSGRDSVAEVAARRGTTVADLTKALRGDLEGIVHRCLEKDRERRYPTANALAEDIGRSLASLPVHAVPWSRGYLLRKFARRHRAALSAAGAIVLVLVAAAVVSVGFAFREAHQRSLAEEAGKRAQAAETAARERADELEQAVTFLQEVLSGIDVPGMGTSLRADLLEKSKVAAARAVPEDEVDARIERLESLIAGSDFTGIALDALRDRFFVPARATIDRKFQTQPLVEARLLQTLASTMQELGLLETAHEPQERALEIRRRELGEDDADTLTSTLGLGTLLHAEGKLDEAEPYLLAAVEGLRRVLGNRDPRTLDAIVALGFFHRERGEFADAEACDREALEGQRRVLGEHHRDTLMTLNNLGSLMMVQGRREEARSYYVEALEGFRATLGNEDPDTLMAMSNVAYLLHAEGKVEEAERLHREALQGRRAVLGDDHPDTLVSMSNLGFLLHDQGRLTEAEPLYREALDKRRLLLGAEHPKTLNSMNNLAGLLKDQGRLTDAEPLYREALATARRVLGDRHLQTLAAVHNLGWLLEAMDRPAEAEQLYREAHDGYRQMLGEEARETLISAGNLGALLLAEGRPAEALALLAPAEPALRKEFTGGNALRLGKALGVLGRCRAAAGEFAMAETNLVEANAILESAPKATREERLSLLNALVDLYDAWESSDAGSVPVEAAASWRARLEEARGEKR